MVWRRDVQLTLEIQCGFTHLTETESDQTRLKVNARSVFLLSLYCTFIFSPHLFRKHFSLHFSTNHTLCSHVQTKSIPYHLPHHTEYVYITVCLLFTPLNINMTREKSFRLLPIQQDVTCLDH